LACGAAHHWARMLIGLGHDVKLIAPEAIRPFVKKGKKNDAADAAALCPAAYRPDVIGLGSLQIATSSGESEVNCFISVSFPVR
jgi:transposase